MKKFAVVLTFVLMGCGGDNITNSRSPNIAVVNHSLPPIFPSVPTFPLDSTWNEDNRGYLVGGEQTELGTYWTFWTDPWYPWNFAYVTDPVLHKIRKGWRSERIEVRPGDCFNNDCLRRPAFERIERTEDPFDETSIPNIDGDTVWYGWSFYFSGGENQLAWAFITQFHEHSPHHNPSWAFFKRKDHPLCLMHDMNNVKNWTCGPWDELPQTGVMDTYPLIPDDQFYDRWHDMVVQVYWSKRNDGFMKIWVNNILVVDYKGLTFDPEAEYMIFKYGIYRTAFDKTNVGYFDEIRRGNRREDVDILMMSN
jgi:hypothetical protein